MTVSTDSKVPAAYNVFSHFYFDDRIVFDCLSARKKLAGTINGIN